MRGLALLAISVAGFTQTPTVYSLEKERAPGKALATEVERGSKILDDRLATEYIQKLADNCASGFSS
jgi:hypothetical protein